MPANAQINFAEGGLGLSGAAAAATPLVLVGPTEKGTTGNVYAYGSASPGQAVSDLGRTALTQLAAAILATPNHAPVLVVPAASTAGTQSAVTADGSSPPTITLTGNALDDGQLRIEARSAGARGTWTFRYCTDYDAIKGTGSWSGDILSAATFAIPNTGVTVNIAVGTASVDNVWSATLTGPTMSNTQVTDAIDAAIASEYAFSHGVVVSNPADATAMGSLFAAVGTKADALETARKYTSWMISAHAPAGSDSASLATWRSALVAASPSLSHKRMAIAAGRCRMTSDVDARSMLRSALFPLVTRFASTGPSEHLGRVRSGALRAVTWIEHNEDTVGGLETSRYSTLRTIAGKQGYYAATPQTFAPSGSDYGPLTNRRVADLGGAALYAALLDYLNDEIATALGTGRILESVAKAIEIDLTSQVAAAMGKHATSVAVSVSRTEDILSTGKFKGQGRIVPKGLATAVEFDIAFGK